MQVESVNDDAVLEAVRGEGIEVAAVCAFGQLIRVPLLEQLPMLNVHPSLLPRWRGAAPIERALMAGDQRTGVSVMRVTEGLDSGPVALREEVAIEPGEDFGSLAPRLAELGGELIVRALDQMAAGTIAFEDQDDADATYAEKIESSERRLDPGRPAPELAQTVRALTPHVGAYLESAGGDRLGVRRARPVERDLPVGEIRAEEGALVLGCGEKALLLEVVQPPGGRPMPAEAYLRGHPLPRL
jgi:methionyl-tRNA formyltransferase